MRRLGSLCGVAYAEQYGLPRTGLGPGLGERSPPAPPPKAPSAYTEQNAVPKEVEAPRPAKAARRAGPPPPPRISKSFKPPPVLGRAPATLQILDGKTAPPMEVALPQRDAPEVAQKKRKREREDAHEDKNALTALGVTYASDNDEKWRVACASF